MPEKVPMVIGYARMWPREVFDRLVTNKGRQRTQRIDAMASKTKRMSGSKTKKQVKSKQASSAEPSAGAIGDNLGRLATALQFLVNATAMSVIAQHGTPAVKERAVAYLMNWFPEFRG